MTTLDWQSCLIPDLLNNDHYFMSVRQSVLSIPNSTATTMMKALLNPAQEQGGTKTLCALHFWLLHHVIDYGDAQILSNLRLVCSKIKDKVQRRYAAQYLVIRNVRFTSHSVGKLEASAQQQRYSQQADRKR
jgi:hypothetical protein